MLHPLYGITTMTLNMPLTATFAGAIPATQILRRTIRQVDASIGAESERLAKSKDRRDTRRSWLMRRATTVWDIDQRIRTEALGRKLRRNPGEVAARLSGSYYGCKHLMERWGYLMRSVASPNFKGDLTPGDRIKALCLLGIPPDEWDDDESPTCTKAIPRDGELWLLKARKQLRDLFTREFLRLNEIAKFLEVEDKEAQAKAIEGEFFDSDRQLVKAEREVASSEGRIRALEKERRSAIKDTANEEPIANDSPASSESTDTTQPPLPDPLL